MWTLVGYDVLPCFDDPFYIVKVLHWVLLAPSVCCFTEYRPHDVTSLTLVKAQHGITPLHPPMLVLVVPRRALTCVSPDGERSVGFDISYLWFQTVCTCLQRKRRTILYPSGFDRVCGDHVS